MNVDGAVVLVTGGARGIGRALGAAFTQRGARVVLADLDGSAAEAAAGDLGCTGRQFDVTDAASAAGVLADIEASVGPVDVIVNNAGIMPLGPHAEEPDELTHRIFEVNLLGPVRLTRLVLPGMVARRRGHVVNLSSSAGVTAAPGGISYSASKAASMRWSEGLRRELHGTGIGVTVVMPGIVRTDLSAGLDDARGIPTVTPELVAARIVGAVERNQADVWVPRRLRVLPALFGLLPSRGSDALLRAVGGARAFAQPDVAARRDYERRVRSGAADLLEPAPDGR